MTPCGEHIRALIARRGPIGVDEYMAMALGHPTLGYYTTRDPLGAAGDFVTAPEVSQMFGELLGLWCADYWARMGAPRRFQFVELGPGRGTWMRDALRAARVVPGFLDAAEIALVETSPVLRAAQARALAASGRTATWRDDVGELPEAPLIILANEFFDALPTRQFVRTGGGWRERVIELDGAALRFGVAPRDEPSIPLDTPEGAVLEVNEAAARAMADIAARIARHGGAALAIDYGHEKSGFADTVQALRRHRFVDPLAEPGEADITTHVDFEALGRAAASAGARVHGPVSQGRFLVALGARERARKLAAGAAPEAAARVASELARLTEDNPLGMGRLFKVMAVAHIGGPEPAGFAP